MWVYSLALLETFKKQTRKSKDDSPLQALLNNLSEKLEGDPKITYEYIPIILKLEEVEQESLP